MGSGTIQLGAKGAQDIYLTEKPETSFFIFNYKKHTNFSTECIEQTMNNTLTASGGNFSVVIGRHGDLITNMHFDVLLPGPAKWTGATDKNYINWCNTTGYALFEHIEVEIGGQKIDRHTSNWLDVWNELTDINKQEYMSINKQTDQQSYLLSSSELNPLQLYVPLKFWFNRNPNLALPIIALQYHDIKINFKTRANTALINHDGTTAVVLNTAPTIKLYCNYIFLDNFERNYFAQNKHEFLITQVQEIKESWTTTPSKNISLNQFNHPVKQIFWIFQEIDAGTANATDCDTKSQTRAAGTGMGNDWFNYSSIGNNDTEFVNNQTTREGFGTATLSLESISLQARKASYYRLIQPLEAKQNVPARHIYCYSFALNPTIDEPSGSCNFSKISNSNLIFTGTLPNNAAGTNIFIYALNYNILKIMNGMAGLAYSN